jgi:aarF domain-containing kinase
LLRPFQVNKNKRAKAEEKPKTEYEQQVELKQRLKSMLENEQLIPRVSLLILVTCVCQLIYRN